MKRVLTFILVAVGLALQAFGQGYVAFDNLYTDPLTITPGTSPVTISITPGAFNPADGAPGAFVGSNYSVTLFQVGGIVTNQAAFDSLNPILIADAVFFGTTGIGPGHGFGGDWSGFFDGGTHRVTGLIDFYATFQVRAWFNGGGLYASYAEALTAGHNAGQSNLLPLGIFIPPGPINNLSGLQPFTVGIPEPSTFLLALLGAVGFLLVHRRGR